ncbi:MAG: T9SS type A sorting domain-containing protein [Bacteroidetes bacterium]|nr:T9SS type A sorting domain-containing protein [Bacteroidota bacterium]
MLQTTKLMFLHFLKTFFVVILSDSPYVAQNGEGYCAGSDECFSYFKVGTTDKPVVSCSQSVNLSGCTTQEAINAAYATWKAGFTFNNTGCHATDNSADVPSLPENILCGDSIGFTYVAQNGDGYCAGSDECFSYFKVGTTDKPVVTCSQSVSLDACMSKEDINAAYATWKAGFTFNNTGCHATDNSAGLPETIACGDSIGFTYTAQNGQGYCAGRDECFSYFKVGVAEKLVVTCSQSVNLPGCTTQEDIAAAYATWAGGFSSAGGCHAYDNKGDIPALPENILCGDSIGFNYIAQNGQGYCADRDACFSYFKVGTTDKPVVTCSQSVTLPGCTSQEAIAAAYATWVDGFSSTGGCHATNNKADVPSLPENILCGDSIGFTFVAQNGEGYCAGSDNCFSYFKVGTTARPVVTCSPPVNLAGCTNDADIHAAYNAWKMGFSVNGGCNPTTNISDIPALPANIACGGEISFTFTAQNALDRCPGSDECTSTFKVGVSTKLVVVCAPPVSLDACSTEGEILAAYNTWKTGFGVSGGCNPTSNIADITALPTGIACGGEISFTLTAENGNTSCGLPSESCTSTFKVGEAPKLVAHCATSVKLDACSSQEAIQIAYEAWKADFGVSGGCDPYSNIADLPGLPEDITCGGKISFTLIAQNGQGKCIARDECTSTFEVGKTEKLSVECTPVELPSCPSEAQILNAYNAWKAGFKATGGCNTTTNIGDLPALPEKMACGGQISFTFVAESGSTACGTQREECSSTFTVIKSTTPFTLICSANKMVDCKATLCLPSLPFDEPKPSGGCGDIKIKVKSTCIVEENGCTVITRVWDAEDACGNTATCSQTITQCPCDASIGDFVWNDKNRNGIQDAGEVGVKNVKVTLYKCSDNSVVATQMTGSNGQYLFTGLTAGSYYVGFSNLPGGYMFTTQNAGGDDAKDSDADGTTGNTACITLAAGENNLTVDAGLFCDPKCAQLGNFVWYDTNRNGKQDVGEGGVCSVKVTLYKCSDNSVVATKTTGSNGQYLFTGLSAGGYYVGFSNLPAGYDFTTQDAGSDDAKDSDPNTTTGKTACINLGVCECNQTVDAGLVNNKPCAQVGDYVWKDTDGDGYQDSNEGGIQNVKVTLYKCSDNSVVGTDYTDGNGKYLFKDLAAGSYYVGFSNLPSGYSFTTQNNGSDDSKDSDPNATTGKTDCFNLAQCECKMTVDAGLKYNNPCAQVGNFVWDDKDKDGKQDANECGVKNVKVTLYNCSNNSVVATKYTDSKGMYLFTNLPAGSYYIGFSNLPSGYSFTTQNAGSDDSKDSDVGCNNGKTSCFTLTNCECNQTIDAGLVSKCRTLRASNDEQGLAIVDESKLNESSVIVFPNPANSMVNIDLTFEDAKKQVTLEIYNVSGQKIAELYKGSAEAQFKYHTEFNVSQLSAGTYFYRLNSDGETKTGKLSVGK